MENGIVKRVIGPVVDVQFPAGKLPEINNAIEVHAGERRIVMEAVQQLGDNAVRCISLFSTDGLQRGCVAVDTGSSVKMPVGEATLGRMFNVIGEPIDGKGPVNATEYLPIHREAPAFTDIAPRPNCSRPASRSLTCSRPMPRAARSVCSAAQASARPCSSWS